MPAQQFDLLAFQKFFQRCATSAKFTPERIIPEAQRQGAKFDLLTGALTQGWSNVRIYEMGTSLNNTIADTPSARTGGGVGQVVPQMWTYEHTLPGGQPARAFVWMQGHVYENFSNPTVQKALLRGIAWAAKQPVGELADYVAPPSGRGGRGGGRGGRGPAQ
jgi:hypothetical protein